MNAPLPPLPASLSRTDADDGDIDARILRVEQRLIAREENVRRGIRLFGSNVGEAMQPRRLIKPALIAVGGLVALAVLPRLLPARRHRPLRRQEHTPDVGEAAVAVAKPAALFALLASLPWDRLLGSIWPVLPQKVRERVSPHTVGSVITLVLPLMESVSAWRRSARR
jgi:apolipoprotein D and lipocalin family protein